MTDEPSMSPSTAYDRAKADPEKASEAIQALFDYVEAETDAGFAAGSLESVANHAPEAFENQTDRFQTTLNTAEESRVRRELTGAVNELVEQQAIPPEDAGPVLTEATRVRDEEHWDDRPKNELAVIQNGLIGWVELAALGETVPGIVVRGRLSGAPDKPYPAQHATNVHTTGTAEPSESDASTNSQPSRDEKLVESLQTERSTTDKTSDHERTNGQDGPDRGQF